MRARAREDSNPDWQTGTEATRVLEGPPTSGPGGRRGGRQEPAAQQQQESLHGGA